MIPRTTAEIIVGAVALGTIVLLAHSNVAMKQQLGQAKIHVTRIVEIATPTSSPSATLTPTKPYGVYKLVTPVVTLTKPVKQ